MMAITSYNKCSVPVNTTHLMTVRTDCRMDRHLTAESLKKNRCRLNLHVCPTKLPIFVSFFSKLPKLLRQKVPDPRCKMPLSIFFYLFWKKKRSNCTTEVETSFAPRGLPQFLFQDNRDNTLPIAWSPAGACLIIITCFVSNFALITLS